VWPHVLAVLITLIFPGPHPKYHLGTLDNLPSKARTRWVSQMAYAGIEAEERRENVRRVREG